MAAKVKEKALAEKLAGLRKARSWKSKAVDRLAEHLRQGDDFSLFRVNPLKFAADKALPEVEVIDLFLHAAKGGLFQMEWNLVCPTCGDSVESFRTLSRMNSHFYCTVCDLNSEATLDDFIQVAFTISPEIREIAYHRPETLSIEEFHLKYHFNQAARIPDGPRFIEAVPSLVKGLAYLGPGQRKRFEVETAGGTLTFNDLIHHTSTAVAVEGAGAAYAKREPVAVRVEGAKIVAGAERIPPGKAAFLVENKTAEKASMLIINFPPDFKKKPLVFEPFLSGKRVLSTQTFRDLFNSETIQGSEGFGVRDLTILFTDLKGSTAMYERIGDMKAFSLVHQHFEHLRQVIRENSGGFVKTIGDAVMASFLNPVDAVKAALEMNQEIAKFNRALTSKDVILKIGIHKGPCIAVTLNDRLDYFGQTVNTAARVQGLAGSEEIYVTEDVFAYNGVKGLLRGFKVHGGKVKLKGIQEETQVYRIAPEGAGNGESASEGAAD
jgi:class 3 adenylate cyclase